MSRAQPSARLVAQSDTRSQLDLPNVLQAHLATIKSAEIDRHYPSDLPLSTSRHAGCYLHFKQVGDMLQAATSSLDPLLPCRPKGQWWIGRHLASGPRPSGNRPYERYVDNWTNRASGVSGLRGDASWSLDLGPANLTPTAERLPSGSAYAVGSG
jgi:hypothetical protein